MHTHKSWFARALALAGLTVAIAAAPATAQTPEGTQIRNIASTTFTDANSNVYAAVADTVDITVGFQAGIDAIATAASVAPAVSSTNDTLYFTVNNLGNGTDSLTITENITVGSIITNVRYWYNSVTYGTLAALNLQLSQDAVTGISGSVALRIIYDVNAAVGGQTTRYELTAASRRTPGTTDMAFTDINPGETFAVAVIEQGSGNDSTTANLVPGTSQTVVFTVTNNGNGPEDIRLETSQNLGAVISVVSITGTGVTQGANPDSGSVAALGVSASVDVTVTFDVANLAAGTVDSLFLLVTAVNDGSANDESAYIVTIVKPALAITKEAFTNVGLTIAVTGDVFPGDNIWYKITVSNSAGTATAMSIDLDDDLPTQVTYVTHGDDGSGWTISKLDGPPEHMDATMVSLAAGVSAYFWIQVTID